jgi:hypothetical protein
MSDEQEKLRLALVKAAAALDAVAAIIRASDGSTAIAMAGAHSIAFSAARSARKAAARWLLASEEEHDAP